MALIIGPQKQSFGSSFGAGLGRGFSQGIEGLVASKLGQLTADKRAKEYEDMGISPAEAKVMARLGEKERGSILQEYFRAPGQGGSQGSDTGSGMDAISYQQQQQATGPQQFTTPSPNQMMMGGLNPLQMNKAILGKGQAPQISPQAVQGRQVPAGQEQLGAKQPISAPQLPTEAALQAAQASQAPTQQQRPLSIAEAKRQREEQAILRKEAIADTKDLRHELEAKSRSAKQTLRDLDRLEELEKTGKLDTAGYVEFLKRSGLDMPALMNPESEEFQKIAYGFMRNAKEVFGSRISNFEIDQFLKTIPSLSQSPEGRKRVIANLKYLSRANVEYNDTKKEIIRENRDFPPLDLADRIDDRMEKKLDTISEKFREDLAKPVPKGQNKFITALQATAGSVAGKIPKVVGGAATGAGIGLRVGGIPGALIGGGLGALAGASGGAGSALHQTANYLD